MRPTSLPSSVQEREGGEQEPATGKDTKFVVHTGRQPVPYMWLEESELNPETTLVFDTGREEKDS